MSKEIVKKLEEERLKKQFLANLELFESLTKEELGNTGPKSDMGTSFSPDRWGAYVSWLKREGRKHEAKRLEVAIEKKVEDKKNIEGISDVDSISPTESTPLDNVSPDINYRIEYPAEGGNEQYIPEGLHPDSRPTADLFTPNSFSREEVLGMMSEGRSIHRDNRLDKEFNTFEYSLKEEQQIEKKREEFWKLLNESKARQDTKRLLDQKSREFDKAVYSSNEYVAREEQRVLDELEAMAGENRLANEFLGLQSAIPTTQDSFLKDNHFNRNLPNIPLPATVDPRLQQAADAEGLRIIEADRVASLQGENVMGGNVSELGVSNDPFEQSMALQRSQAGDMEFDTGDKKAHTAILTIMDSTGMDGNSAEALYNKLGNLCGN